MYWIRKKNRIKQCEFVCLRRKYIQNYRNHDFSQYDRSIMINNNNSAHTILNASSTNVITHHTKGIFLWSAYGVYGVDSIAIMYTSIFLFRKCISVMIHLRTRLQIRTCAKHRHSTYSQWEDHIKHVFEMRTLQCRRNETNNETNFLSNNILLERTIIDSLFSCIASTTCHT